MYYDVVRAQEEFAQKVQTLENEHEKLTEVQCAVLFAQILVRQTGGTVVTFCSEEETYVSKTPVGYDVVGFFIDHFNQKVPFSISVAKQNGLWFPAQKYVAADTKSCSTYIWLWVLLCVGCALMGILMYHLMSAAIGI